VSDPVKLRDASESVGWLNSEGPLSTSPSPAPQTKRRGSYLAVGQQFNLEHQCRLLTAAFGACSYQVGSSLQHRNFRDVDIRCILNDEEYDAVINGNDARLKLFNTAISEWLAARTGLPVDFQFQRMTQANAEFDEQRSFVGATFSRTIGEQRGDH
jgi:hypothetical protein